MKTLTLACAVLTLLFLASHSYAWHLERENALLQAQLDDAQSLMGCVDNTTPDLLLTKAEP